MVRLMDVIAAYVAQAAPLTDSRVWAITIGQCNGVKCGQALIDLF